MRLILLLIFSLLFLTGETARAESSQEPGNIYPEIGALHSGNLLFRQLQQDISRYHLRSKSNEPLPQLFFYQYIVKKNQDFFSLASRINLPYDTLASLNGIRHPSQIDEGSRILIPNMPGLFVPVTPQNDLEYMMAALRADSFEPEKLIKIKRNDSFYFLPGERFHSLERAYFLQILFRFPVDRGRISSRFGVRQSPFTGHRIFHNGIDIAAGRGESVLAARGGEVVETGADPIYGKYILIDHEGGYSTFYGHLEKQSVSLHDRIYSGMIIGRIGSTGRSTGPHLHFEIRRDNELRDPVQLMPNTR
ncbi:MAG: M23 family metallopeptidase [Spirochaetales bacterium]|nr:M23 family metallopeptidase [Spirochaetales bacterium]MCF7937297.1 M23 family metallopeptidase [Spirochaetales bacterium]